MTLYRDTNGNQWDNAQEALDEFLSDLPNLTEEETEAVFQFTNHAADADDNLRAIAYGITYSGLDDKFSGNNYPVPEEYVSATWEEAWDQLLEMGVSEEALILITSINGSSIDTMQAVLFSRFGYRDFDQV